MRVVNLVNLQMAMFQGAGGKGKGQTLSAAFVEFIAFSCVLVAIASVPFRTFPRQKKPHLSQPI